MGSLKNTQARLFHGYALKFWPLQELENLEEVAWFHTLTCQHKRCKQVKHRTDSLHVPVINQLIWLADRE